MNDKRTRGNIQIFGILLAPTGTIRGRNKLDATLTSVSYECESQRFSSSLKAIHHWLLIVELFEKRSALFL